MTNSWFDGTDYTPLARHTLGRADAINNITTAIVNGFDAAYASVNSLSIAGGIQIPYTFSTTTTDSDPGAGILRLDNAAQNGSTTIRVDLAGSDGIDRSSQLTQFNASTSAVKGLVRLAKVSDSTKYLIFEVTAMASPAGYRNVTVICVDFSSASPFLNGDAIMLYFSRNGDASTAPVNFARVTVASAATTADIWTGLGNQIDWTGTTTCTGFPAAPQAGAERVLICAGAAPFTAGANMLIDGVASAATVTCAANDIVIVRAVSTTQFKLSRVKYDGTAQVSAGINEVTVHTGNGHGSTNTKIRRFTTTLVNTGTAITYADSVTNGGSFTINETGIYAIDYHDDAAAGSPCIGLSLNSAQLTTAIFSVSVENRLSVSVNTAGIGPETHCMRRFVAGDIIRAHSGGTVPDVTTDSCKFSITKIGTS